MKHFVGNLNQHINCDEIILELKQHDVMPSHGHMQLPEDNPYYSDYINQTKMLTAVGYTDQQVEYRHYQSGTHFDSKVSEIIGNFVNATPLMCWISEVRPGKCVPWHWDINPWEEEHKKLGEVVRYFCFLSKPYPGHILVVEQDAYYFEEQGALYKYPDAHAWHAGSNVGLEPKFLLTFTGVKKIN